MPTPVQPLLISLAGVIGSRRAGRDFAARRGTPATKGLQNDKSAYRPSAVATVEGEGRIGDLDLAQGLGMMCETNVRALIAANRMN